MKTIIRSAIICAAFGLTAAMLPAQDLPEGVEVQARGPLHEAFAAPVDGEPTPGRIIDRQPPEPIEEVPADQKPDGQDVEWIPGYWAWDDARTDFIWVSGFWRVAPPDRSWVPGSWRQVADGWQWVAGFWRPDAQPDVQYLPQPPASLEAGPTIPSPGPEYVYTPGTWVYHSYRYAWRPGTWVSHRPGWVWIPSTYRWTPVGYVYIGGYWDYPLRGRGLLFSPVWIDRRVCYRPTWRYSPSFVVYDDGLYSSMFVRPGGHHYYFGDYFDARFSRIGYRSWFSVSFSTGYRYDPLFSYYSVQHRSDPYWGPAIRDVYAARYAGHLPRPPVTIVNNARIVNNTTIINSPTIVNNYVNINRSKTVVNNITNVNNTVVNVRQVNNTNINNTNVNNTTINRGAGNGLALKAVSNQEREQFAKSGREFRNIEQQRTRLEGQLQTQGGTAKTGEAPRSLRVDQPKINAGRSDQTRRQAPPPAVTGSNPTTGNQPNGPGRPSISTPNNPGSGRNRPGTNLPGGNTKPPISDVPPTGGSRPSTTPPTGNPKPPVSNPPTGGSRPSITPPTGNPKPPVSNPPTGGSRPSITPPSGNPKPPVSNPPTGGSRPSTTPPTGNPKPPIGNPPTGGSRPSTTPPTRNPKPPIGNPPTGGSRPSTTPPTGNPKPPMGTPPSRGPRPEGSSTPGKPKRPMGNRPTVEFKQEFSSLPRNRQSAGARSDSRPTMVNSRPSAAFPSMSGSKPSISQSARQPVGSGRQNSVGSSNERGNQKKGSRPRR